MMYRHFDSTHVEDEVLVEANFGWLNDCANYNDFEREIYFYHKDHLGSSTQITDREANVIHHIEYMPSGEQFVEQRSTWGTSYKFNSKELDQETGLYYYGARYYNPTLSIWGSVDPLSDKYPSMSPYMYCAGNPVILVDPDGREIDPASVDEWNKQKHNISNKRDEFKGHVLINKLSGGKLFQKETDRYNSLGNTLNTMDIMESSTQMYSLEVTTGNTGETRMNKDGSITLSFSSTALFTHEVTHGGQYESGDLGFIPGFGGILDYWDEFEAYDAQAAFDPNSIPNKESSGNKEWLLGIKEINYRNHGEYPINSNSGADAAKKAYPKWNFNDFGKNETLKTYFNDVKFKK